MRRVLVAVLALVVPSTCSADLVPIEQTFQTDTSTGVVPVGNTYILTLTGLTVDGVTFDATLNVTGASTFGSGNLQVVADGLGVDSEFIENTESVTYTMALSNVAKSGDGRSVVFDGFTSIDFNSFTAADGDTAFVNGSLITGDRDEEALANLTTVTVAGGVAFGGGATVFNLDDITASFSSVPEPSSLAFGLIALGPGLFRRRRR